MICHQFCLSGNVGRGKMSDLQGLRLDPTQRFKIFEEEIIFGKLGRQFDAVVTASLGNPGYSLTELDVSSSNHATHLKLTLISLTCLLSGGETPYKKAAT